MTWLFSLTAIGTPSLPDLTNEVASVMNWYRLGLNLGMMKSQLDVIEIDHTRNIDQCKIEMLSCWLKSAKHPTWKAVADALNWMSHHVAALEIKKRYCSSSSVIGM